MTNIFGNALLGVKGSQTIPQRVITNENLVESVQLLQDLMGASKFGKVDQDHVDVCGIRLASEAKVMEFIKNLQNQIDELKGSGEN